MGNPFEGLGLALGVSLIIGLGLGLGIWLIKVISGWIGNLLGQVIVFAG